MILRLDGSLIEHPVAWDYEEKRIWIVKQDWTGFTAVYREGEREEVLGRYDTFEEAHQAASEAADEAFLEIAYQYDSPWDDLETSIVEDDSFWEELKASIQDDPEALDLDDSFWDDSEDDPLLEQTTSVHRADDPLWDDPDQDDSFWKEIEALEEGYY